MRAVIVLLALAVLAPIARAESEAEKLYNQGQAAYEALDYEKALGLWERSYNLSKLPALLFNIAQAHRLRGKPGDCTKATLNYRRFIAALPKSNERPTAEGFIAELGPCVEAESKPQVVTPPPVVSDPVTPPPSTMPVVPQRDESPGKGKRFAGYAVGGAGIVLVITGVYFGAKARRIGDEVSDDCRDGCDWNLVKDKDAEGKSAETTQYVLYGVGLAAVAAGGVLWWMGNKERSSSTVAITPTSGGAAISWSGGW